jgi:hypothetical protein
LMTIGKGLADPTVGAIHTNLRITSRTAPTSAVAADASCTQMIGRGHLFALPCQVQPRQKSAYVGCVHDEPIVPEPRPRDRAPGLTIKRSSSSRHLALD